MTRTPSAAQPPAVAGHCLAGSGSHAEARQALHVLTGARGWPQHYDPEAESTFVSSPCGLVPVGYLPGHFWPWKLNVADSPMQLPRWRAEFSPQTPPVVVSAILDTVARALETDPDRLTGTTYDAAEATAVLVRAGWRTEHTDTHTIATSPEPQPGLAGLSVQCHPEPWQDDPLDQFEDTVALWCGAPDSPERWSVDFSRETPMHLVAAITRELVPPVAPRPALDRTSRPRMTAARGRPAPAEPASPLLRESGQRFNVVDSRSTQDGDHFQTCAIATDGIPPDPDRPVAAFVNSRTGKAPSRLRAAHFPTREAAAEWIRGAKPLPQPAPTRAEAARLDSRPAGTTEPATEAAPSPPETNPRPHRR
ncbi:DUF317 domain-containing protein [Kitasatospora griseola]|uniref:DUF317 domain-containing protein n=1 Tax=Kitasatospora griseola TaxID=2064 RepID=UPI0034389E60